MDSDPLLRAGVYIEFTNLGGTKTLREAKQEHRDKPDTASSILQQDSKMVGTAGETDDRLIPHKADNCGPIIITPTHHYCYRPFALHYRPTARPNQTTTTNPLSSPRLFLLLGSCSEFFEEVQRFCQVLVENNTFFLLWVRSDSCEIQGFCQFLMENNFLFLFLF